MINIVKWNSVVGHMTEIRYLLIRLAINVFKLCVKNVLTVNGFESKTKNHIQNLRFSKQIKNQNQIKLRNLHKTAAMWRFSCSTVDHSMFELFFFPNWPFCNANYQSVLFRIVAFKHEKFIQIRGSFQFPQKNALCKQITRSMATPFRKDAWMH